MLIWNSYQENQEVDQKLNAYETQNKLSKASVGFSGLSEKTEVMDYSGQIGLSPEGPNASIKSSGGSAKNSKASMQIQNSKDTVKGQRNMDGQLLTRGQKATLPVISDYKNTQNTPLIWHENQLPLLNSAALRLQEISYLARETEINHKEEKVTRKNPFAGKFNVSVQAAPDLSGIKLNQVGKAGQAIGIGAEYFLRPKISVASGVFYSFKPYSADEGYQLDYGDQPDRVLGECDILDIPLNLRFYPIEGKLQRFFASAGLSSYLMLKEHYKLEYQDTGTGYPYSREIDVSGDNNHFFGVVNLSVGYERKLGDQLSVQVEPYFKVPITGVGEGDISLKSTGLFVGLKFHPNLPKRQ
ncbi:hypothetical protein LZF95_24625 [Algoriphagus sp. AGSA1]|uniref:hypothetical protein n=1 Tax=Algoriphagus sp. AGSA1 TaxID=2907213 RepID=UPI001F2131C8|nr:hypothetical protein [Algoriphagus sp. AGSA1]MCE7057892.1 hypothetical protein [Algoriphagus sp. AGSA1]